MAQRHWLAVAAITLGLFSSARAADSEPAAARQPAAGAGFKLEKGQHVCLVGNSLAERMQHHGWMETLIHARFPEHELVFRNLGYSGDEVPLDANRRLRSANFGAYHEWLAGTAPPPHKLPNAGDDRFKYTNTRADVVFAFFGYNESYAGEKGLEAFKGNLEKMLKEMLARKYNGKSAPRIVLFSPIAFEDLKDPNLPPAEPRNKNLKLYTEAMAEVAKANGVVFVDLFTPTLERFGKGGKPHTINGVHLNEAGDRAVAEIIDRALFGNGAKSTPDAARLARLREAVNDKNFYWFHRYRVVDGFNVYGGRSKEAYNDNIHNRKVNNWEVMQREMEVLDVMTSNRDKRVWAAAQGKDLKVDDSNTPEFIPVGTNKPGKGPNGEHVYLSGEEEIGKMTLAPGLKVNLFADEKMFPELINPHQMAFDTQGRLWVLAWPTYPHWKPKTPMNDKLLILEDTDNDGKADKRTVFAGNLSSPSGFEFWNGGVLLAEPPYLLFLKDTNGDGKADVRERVIGGLDSADTHHAANSFTFDPGGALYFQEGTFHHSQVENAWGPPERVANGAVFRFEPRTHKFDVYVSYPFANPHGHVFDYWGTDIVNDGTSAVPYYGPSFSGKTYFPTKHQKAPVVYKQRTRPLPATEILSSRHFPDEYQGNFLAANVIGFQGILNYKLEEKGAGLAGKEMEPILSSSDPNFRPADLEMGPDGALYFTDWQNAIIGHLQHHLRDASRDHHHGRVYRVTHESRPLMKPVKIAGEPIEKLLDLLKEPENRTRYRAKIELSGRPSDRVVAAVQKWVAGLDKSDKAYEHHMAEALWMHQWHDVVNEDLLKRQLRSPDHHARAAATRVLCYWRDRVKDPLELLKVQVADEHPRVRLEAVRACSFFTDPAAVEVALESLNKEQDEFLKYSLDETMKTLEKHAK